MNGRLWNSRPSPPPFIASEGIVLTTIATSGSVAVSIFVIVATIIPVTGSLQCAGKDRTLPTS
jgi:hypothetical protein